MPIRAVVQIGKNECNEVNEYKASGDLNDRGAAGTGTYMYTCASTFAKAMHGTYFKWISNIETVEM